MNQLPTSIQEATQSLLQKKFGNNLIIKSFSSSAGGCINHGGRLHTSHGSFFIKWNDVIRFPNMFHVEASGLGLLKNAKAIRFPDVIAVGEVDTFQFIILEYIESQRPTGTFWKSLAEQLAQLHAISDNQFGLDHNNYMGSLHQRNDQTTSWTDFFIANRLQVQLKLAVDSGKLSNTYVTRFEKLYAQLPSLLPDEKASLVHGDLWSGNLLCDEQNQPCLIDPAVYFGSHEVDLAMTKLFGGFDPEFYDVFSALSPAAPGLEERMDIYNLYPLLVHVNLFGSSYIDELDAILKGFEQIS